MSDAFVIGLAGFSLGVVFTCLLSEWAVRSENKRWRRR
jgi:hypothetical protein